MTQTLTHSILSLDQNTVAKLHEGLTDDQIQQAKRIFHYTQRGLIHTDWKPTATNLESLYVAALRSVTETIIIP